MRQDALSWMCTCREWMVLRCSRGLTVMVFESRLFLFLPIKTSNSQSTIWKQRGRWASCKNRLMTRRWLTLLIMRFKSKDRFNEATMSICIDCRKKERLGKNLCAWWLVTGRRRIKKYMTYIRGCTMLIVARIRCCVCGRNSNLKGESPEKGDHFFCPHCHFHLRIMQFDPLRMEIVGVPDGWSHGI